MSQNKLIIEFNENGMKWGLENPASYETLIRVGLQFIRTVTDHAIETFPDAREEFFDMVNHGATNILRDLNENYNPHPNLTEVAILLAENTLLKQAEARGLTLEEFLPEAKIIQERDFELFKRNEEGRRRHNRKVRKEKNV